MSENYDQFRIGLTDAARQLIREIPTEKLAYAKPRWIYKSLEGMGFSRSATMRTTVCKLLIKAKKSGSNAPAQTDPAPAQTDRFTRQHIFLAQQKIAEAFKLLRYDADMLLEETSQVVSISKVVIQKEVVTEKEVAQEVVAEPKDAQEVAHRDVIRQFINKMTPEQLFATTPKLICYELGLEDNQDAYLYTTKFIYKKRRKSKTTRSYN